MPKAQSIGHAPRILSRSSCLLLECVKQHCCVVLFMEVEARLRVMAEPPLREMFPKMRLHDAWFVARAAVCRAGLSCAPFLSLLD